MEVIVKAEEIKYVFDLKQLNETTFRVICIYNDIIYNKTFFSYDEWWLNNKKYFQDSFEEFIKILKYALIENNESFNINVIPEYLDKLNILIKYNSSFLNFEILIDVQREPTLEEKFEKFEEKFKNLEERFKLIEFENINLKEKITKIEKETDDEEWHVFPYKNCCIKPEQSGEILDFTTLDNAKRYCIQKQYSCFVLFNCKVYFRKSSYEESIIDVKLTHDNDSNCTTYIPFCQKQWKIFNDTDCFPGEDIEIMNVKDLIQCKALCIQKGYGGFVIYENNAYFRNKPRIDCLKNVNKTDSKNTKCITYIPPIINNIYGKGMITDRFHGGHGSKHIFYHYKNQNDKLPNPLWDTHMNPNEFCNNCKFIKKYSKNIDQYQCFGH